MLKANRKVLTKRSLTLVTLVASIALSAFSSFFRVSLESFLLCGVYQAGIAARRVAANSHRRVAGSCIPRFQFGGRHHDVFTVLVLGDIEMDGSWRGIGVPQALVLARGGQNSQRTHAKRWRAAIVDLCKGRGMRMVSRCRAGKNICWPGPKPLIW